MLATSRPGPESFTETSTLFDSSVSAPTSTRVGDHRGERLVNLVRDRSGYLAERRDAADMGEFRPCLLQRFFGLAGAHRRGDVAGGAAVTLEDAVRIEYWLGAGRYVD